MDVFISYRRTAAIWAESIRDRLSERNVDAFLDTHEIRNDDFFEMISWNIDESPNFLLLLSEDSFRPQGEDVDYYRWEIEQAIKKNKNLIVVKVGNFIESMVDWSKENEYVSKLKTFNNDKFSTDSQKADIDNIINLMRNEDGTKWQYVPQDNSNWYALHPLTKEDTIWMETNYKVCERMDANLLKLMIESEEWQDTFEIDDCINYFCLDLYNPNALEKKINYKDSSNKINVYGFCHDMTNLEGKNTLEDCDDRFGKNHFIDCCQENQYEQGLDKLLELNNIEYFDVIECTLVLKDCQNPKKVISLLKRYLNPSGGFIYIRDLDDDFVAYHPDENGYMYEMMKLIRKDPAAGNRHLGKQILDLFKYSGARATYISDEIVSTANLDDEDKEDICNAYFHI